MHIKAGFPLLLTVCLSGLVFPGAALAAEMYQWVDANGKKHFTDKPPPPGTAAERSVLKTVPPLTRPEPEPEYTDEQRAQMEQQARIVKTTEQQRREYEKQRQERLDRQNAEYEKRIADRAREREMQKQAEKDAKCKRLKDVADKAYAFKGRYEQECRQ